MPDVLPEGVDRDALTDYQRGYIDALHAYAYSTSAAWAETGVLYVGTTGETLRSAIAEFLEEQGVTRA